MSLEGIIVGVDLDGVCADFYGRMREIAAEWFECRAEDLTENVSYGLTEWGVKPEKYESLHRFAVLQRSLSIMPPKAYRWIAEMHEIADFVGEDPSAHELYVGAAHFYEQIAADFDGDKAHVTALMEFLNQEGKK